LRLVALGLALALAGTLPAASAAQAPVTTQPLAAGEVLLEVNALGVVTTHADRATLTFGITGSGATEAAARAAAERKIGDVRAMLRRQGVADADIRIGAVNIGGTTVEEQLAAAATMAAMNDVAAEVNNTMESGPPEDPVSATAMAEVVVRNVDRAAAIQSELAQNGMFALPTYTLTDDSAPRREARAQALRRAQTDAQSYAAPLHMRVLRVVRITERVGVDMLGMLASEGQTMTRLFQPPSLRTHGPDVQTMVVVGVDFALAAQ
jgi:uncharacterized protein YggE